jgi:polar amino acid transport system permease protein
MGHFTWDWHFVGTILPQLLQGLRLTVLATLCGSVVSFVMGMVWTLGRMADIPMITPAIEFFVQFIRGTPLLIQLFFLYYVFPTWGITLPAFTTGVIGLGLFYSSYTAEIYRAGIENLPVGQWEAALTLGLPLRRVWIGIVLPQSIKAILPMLGNQVIGMFKESALLSTITVMELLGQATTIGSIDFRYVEPLTLVGALYFGISYSAAKAVRRLEGDHALRA